MANTSDYKHFVPPVPLNPHYRESLNLILIETLDQLKESFKKGYVMAWDTETTGLNPTESEIVGFSYSYDGVTAYYCPVKHFDLALGKPSLDLFYQALKDAKLQLLYNARFDIRMMEYSGYDMSIMYPKDPVTGQSAPKFIDVMNCSWLSDTNVLMPSLKASTLHFLGHQPPKFLETLGSEQNFQYVPAKQAYEYACFTEDTSIVTKHGLKQIKDLKIGDLIYTSIGYKKLKSILPQGMKKVIKVTTPDHTSFKCTPDHKFAFQVGGAIFWVQAKDLNCISFYQFYRGGASINHIEEIFEPDLDKYLPSSGCSIEYLEDEEDVYDLSIEDEHNFKLQCGLLAHNCEDAANTYNLFKATYRYYKESGLAAKLDNQCVYIIGQLEKTPLNMDTDYLIKLRDDVYNYVQETEQRIYAIAGHPFKIASNRELTQVFQEQGIDTGERTKAGDMKTSIELLNLYLRNHPDCELLNLLIEYKEKFKLYNSYLKTLVDIAKQQDTVPPRFSYKLQSVPCLTANNLVLIKDKGLVSIKEVKDQDFIWTQYGYKRVLWNNAHKTKDVIRVVFSNGLFIEGTSHHPVLVNNGDINNIKLEWATLGDLRIGESVIFNHHTPIISSDGVASDLLDFSSLLGILLSPNLITKMYDDYYKEEVKNNLVKLKNNKYVQQLKIDELFSINLLEFITSNKPICWVRFLQGLFTKTFETSIARQWNDESDFSKFYIYSDTPIFLTIIMGMLFYLGIPSELRYDNKKSYLLLDSVQSLTLFKNIIVEDSDSTYLKDLFFNYNRSNYFLEYADAFVSSKEILDDEQVVYDIEVEDVHEYVANGVVTHNTGRLSCLNKCSLVHTKQGLIPIVDITNEHDIEVDYNRYSKGFLIDMGEKPFLRFTLHSGRCIECTPDHKFLCPTDLGYVWRYAQDLKKGDLVCKTRVTYKGYNLVFNMFLYGFFLGDGSYYNSGNQRVLRLFFGEKDLETMEYIHSNLDSLCIKHTCKHDKGKLWSIRVYGTQINTLESMFPVANVKQCDRDVDFSWIHSKEDAFSLLAGVYQAEGEKHIRLSDGKMNSSLNVTSYKLVVSLQKLADYVGIRTRIRTIKIDHNKHPTHHAQWKLQFLIKSFRKYLDSSIPFRINTKKDVPKFLTESLNTLPKSVWKDGERAKFKAMYHNKRYSLYSVFRLCEESNLPIEVYDYEEITNVENAGIQNAYTLSINDSKHQYIAEGVINHNCITGDTLIPTTLGDIPIEELSLYEDGNEVFIDHKTTAPFHTLYMGEKECVQLNLKNNRNIVCTLDHKFLNSKTEWVEVKDLMVGDILLSVQNNVLTTTSITNIIPKGILPVYTLSVNHPRHQYLSNTLISHNCGKDAKNTYFAPINLQCLEENTIIKTDRGNIPIKNVKDGDLIWTGNRYAPCKPLGSKKEYCYKIKTLWGEIEASLEHQFLTLNYQTYDIEWHTLEECIHHHYPIVRDPQALGSSFDDIYNHPDYRSLYHLRKSLNLDEYKYYLEYYKDYKFDIILECSKEFWNKKLDPVWLKKTVYDLYVPEYNQFTANGYIVHNSIPKPKSIKCYGRKATQEEIDQHLDILGWVFSPDHPEWSPGKVVEGMSDHLNVRKAFVPEHPENGDYVVSIDMCLEGGSPVQTKRGYMGISELKVGDKIYSPQGWVDVIRVMQTGVKKLIKVLPDNGGQAIYCTEDHHFILNGEKIEAKNIKEPLPSLPFYSYNKNIEDRNIIIKSLSPLLDINNLKNKVEYILDNNLKDIIVEGLNKYTRANISRWCGVRLSSFGHVLEYLNLPKTEKLYQCKFDTYVNNPFVECTPTSAYLLGFIFGDGNISEYNNRLTLNISSKDFFHLKRIGEIFGEDVKIRHNIKGKNEWFTLDIHNKELCETLMSLGVKKRKSYVGCDLPVSWLGGNIRHFIRGLLDSDGSVRHQTHSYLSFSLSGHDSYIKELYDISPDIWRYEFGKSLSFLYLNGTKDDKKFIYSYLYKDATIWLQRKRDIIEQWYIDNFGDIILPVWNITVDTEEHLYYVNGVLTSNCSEELRIVTNLYNEHNWAEVINSGGDLHHANSDAIFGPENYTKETRKKAKSAAFGMLYGQEAVGFQRKFPDMTMDEAREFMAKFKQAIPNITRGQQRTLSEAKRTGTFYTSFGRPRRVKSYLTSSNYREIAFGQRTVKNGIIQGTAADVLKLELVRLWDYVFTQYPEIKWICTIHDEINFSVPRSLANKVIPILVRCMTVKMNNWLVSLDCGLSVGMSLGDIIPFKYNFETKEFVPEWEEDTRKERHEDKDDLEYSDSDSIEELPIEEIDSKMFDL